MARDFEELDYQKTDMGELILRRRRVLALEGREVHEIILGDAFLMSSLFNTVEIALADLALAELEGTELEGSEELEVVVGGLGLGFTADAALKHRSVGSLLVVETMKPVISWHERGLVPLGDTLSNDSRCRFVHGDFFAMAASPEEGFDPDQPGRKFHGIFLDIDHTPEKILSPSHAAFYTEAGLRKLAENLHPGGIFSLWSDDPPDAPFVSLLGKAFASAKAEEIHFDHPIQDRQCSGTVYLARTAG